MSGINGIHGIRTIAITQVGFAGQERHTSVGPQGVTLQTDFHPVLDGATVTLVLNDGRIITVGNVGAAGPRIQVLGPDSETLLELDVPNAGEPVVWLPSDLLVTNPKIETDTSGWSVGGEAFTGAHCRHPWELHSRITGCHARRPDGEATIGCPCFAAPPEGTVEVWFDLTHEQLQAAW